MQTALLLSAFLLASTPALAHQRFVIDPTTAAPQR
jgi:hypothetical protein